MAKPKVIFILTADQINTNKNQSSCRFIEEAKPEGDAAGRRLAKTIIMGNFTDPETALQFKSGKEYVITIVEKEKQEGK